ncbi:MAG: hypothetical protein J5999_08625 [Oscillospiraceae bacterium]|nr:hypothetical protein [Oscillospiraceae bacterium]
MKHTKSTILAIAVCAAMLCGCQAKPAAEETTLPADTDGASAETTAAETTASAEAEPTETTAPAKPKPAAEKVAFPSEITDETAGDVLSAAFANTVNSLNAAFAPDSLAQFEGENKTVRIDVVNGGLTFSGIAAQNGDTADMSLSVDDKSTGKTASFGLFCDSSDAVLSIITPDNKYFYGVNMDTAEEDIKKSIFAPDSGSDFAISEDFDFSTLVPDTEKYTKMTEQFADMPLTVSEDGDNIIITAAAEGDKAYEFLFGRHGVTDYSEYKDYYIEMNGGKEPDAVLTAEFTADKTTEELISAKVSASITGDVQDFTDAGYEVNFGSDGMSAKILENGEVSADISIICDKTDGYSLSVNADTVSAYTDESEKTNISLNSKDGKFTLSAKQAGEELMKMTGTVTDENGKLTIASDSFTLMGEDAETDIIITVTECGSLTKPESKPFFSITEEEFEAMGEAIGDSLYEMFEESDSALGDYIRKSKEASANSNAKTVYINAATYMTNCEIRDCYINYSSTGGSIGDYIDEKPAYDGTEADFKKALAYYMGSEDGGYYYVIFENGAPSKAMWSADPAFGEAAEKGGPIDLDGSCIVGCYPAE